MNDTTIIFPYNQREALYIFDNEPEVFRKDLLSSLQGESGLFFETFFTDPEDPFILTLYETDKFEDSETDHSTYSHEINKCYSSLSSVSFISPNTKTDLIIPCNVDKDYGHFLKFLLYSTKTEWKNLWIKIAIVIKKKKRVRVWTHGLSVPWLHIRITQS